MSGTPIRPSPLPQLRAIRVDPSLPRMPDWEWLVDALQRPAPTQSLPAGKRAALEPLYQATLQSIRSHQKRPNSSERVQLSATQNFDQVRNRHLSHLAAMGIDALYLMPILESGNGYDIYDHATISARLGADVGFEKLADAAHEENMSVIVDEVPNHMAMILDPQVEVVWDVLEHGALSRFAPIIDNEWREGLDLPFLAYPIAQAVRHDVPGEEEGRLRLHFRDGRFQFSHWENRTPLRPEDHGPVLKKLFQGKALPALEKTLLSDIDRLSTRIGKSTSPTRRHELTQQLKTQLKQLGQSEIATELLGEPMDRMGKDPGYVETLLERQPYRLHYWKKGPISYRTFFEEKKLVGVRTEDPRVMVYTSRRFLTDIKKGRIDAVRLDHPDGLSRPTQYLERLSECAFLVLAQELYEKAQRPESDWPAVAAALVDTYRLRRTSEPTPPPVLDNYMEKIRNASKEPLRPDWRHLTLGTVGYEVLASHNSLFSANIEKLYDIHSAYTSLVQEPWEERVLAAKHVMTAGGLNPVATRLDPTLEEVLSACLAYVPDQVGQVTSDDLKAVFAEYLIALDVYRTYIEKLGMPLSVEDERAIRSAMRHVRKCCSPEIPAQTLAMLERLVSARPYEGLPTVVAERFEHVALSTQQTTAPIEAKGLEDTLFPRNAPAAWMREVGGNEEMIGLDEWHRRNLERTEVSPGNMLTSTTHDTKQGEGARDRGQILSEFPLEWADLLQNLSQVVAPLRGDFKQPAVEYNIFQKILMHWPPGPVDDLIGPPPAAAGAVEPKETVEKRSRAQAARQDFTARLQAFELKWNREAKLDTNWIDQNHPYEAALRGFIDRLMENPEALQLLGDFKRKLEPLTTLNLLSQQQINIALPGVADFYQGTDLPTGDSPAYSFVDPDNRREPDIQKRIAARESIEALLRQHKDDRVAVVKELMKNLEDGRLHMYCRMTSLHDMKSATQAEGGLHEGSYVPLKAAGPAGIENHIAAFARLGPTECVINVAPRHAGALVGSLDAADPIGEVSRRLSAATLTLPPGTEQFGAFENKLTGQRVNVRIAPSGRRVLDLGSLLDPLPLGELRGIPSAAA